MSWNRIGRFVLAAVCAAGLLQMHANAQSAGNACEWVKGVCTDIFCAASSGKCIIVVDCLCAGTD